jgi:hypothetical protein
MKMLFAAVHGTSVWTGRAVQAGCDDLEIKWSRASVFGPLKGVLLLLGHHGYPRASDLIRVKALKGR